MSASVPPSALTSRLAFPGAVLAGKYRLEEVVGTGGMGSVWSATHTGLGGHVAIKLVSATFVRSSEALRRLDTEAKAAAPENPRLLWVLGPIYWNIPAERGGGQDKATRRDCKRYASRRAPTAIPWSPLGANQNC